MPWSGSCQRRSTACTIASRTRQSLVAHRAARVGDGGDQVGDRAEDVELDLAVGRVADPDRPRAGVAGQGVDDGLGPELEPVDRVERVQPLRVAAGALDAAVDPAQQRLGLLERAEVDQRPRGHRRVAQPAVAVVPVADAAELLRQRRGRRGEDRAGRLVAEPAQRQRAAQHLLSAPCRAAAVSATQSRHGCSACACRSSIELGCAVAGSASRSAARARTRPPAAARSTTARARVVAAVVEDVPLDARRVERDRLVGAEHQQPVAERLELDRHLAELGPRRELEPRRRRCR